MTTSHEGDPLDSHVLVEAARHGVSLRRRLVATHGASHVVAQLSARRWQAPTSDVVVLHNGPLTPEQRVWVVLMAAPPGSMLHGLSAAVHDGLAGFTPDGLHIVVPGSSRSRRAARIQLPRDWDVSVRWSTQLTVRDVSPAALPPRTRIARSIVDAASERVAPRRARVIVLAAVQQRLVTTAALWDALSRRGRCRNRAVIAESLLDASGGVESLPEREFALICRQAGLPEPERQRILRTPGGRFYLDTDWPTWGVRTEIHGIPHHDIPRWDEDLLRQNEIAIKGAGLLVFSSYATRHLGDRVAAQLHRMFEAHGWRRRSAA